VLVSVEYLLKKRQYSLFSRKPKNIQKVDDNEIRGLQEPNILVWSTLHSAFHKLLESLLGYQPVSMSHKIRLLYSYGPDQNFKKLSYLFLKVLHY